MKQLGQNQWISLSEINHKPRRGYKIQSTLPCICGCDKKKLKDLNKGKDTKDHLYQYICEQCGRSSEPKSYKTLATDAWNNMQRKEKQNVEKNLH